MCSHAKGDSPQFRNLHCLPESLSSAEEYEHHFMDFPYKFSPVKHRNVVVSATFPLGGDLPLEVGRGEGLKTSCGPSNAKWTFLVETS